MSWLHSQRSNFVFTVPILLEGTVYECVLLRKETLSNGNLETVGFLEENTYFCSARQIEQCSKKLSCRAYKYKFALCAVTYYLCFKNVNGLRC